MFTFLHKYFRRNEMTANELELINLIRNDENPSEAFKIAIDLLFERLDALGVFQGTTVVPHQEASETT